MLAREVWDPSLRYTVVAAPAALVMYYIQDEVG